VCIYLGCVLERVGYAGKEVLQSSVEDVASFKVWAKEAFELWKCDWAACYEVRYV